MSCRYFFLVILVIPLTARIFAADVPSDSDFLELEQQIQKQETEMKKKEEAEAERHKQEQRLMEEQKQLEREKARLEEQRRKLEEERLQEQEKKRELEIAEQEKKEKYDRLIKEAEQAFLNKEKNVAVSKYSEALLLYPDDVNANLGLRNAEKLKHKLCYEVLGEWVWDKAFGQDIMILNEDGTINYQTIIKGSGSWECTNPENRMIKIRLSAGGFSNEWISEYSNDGTCLKGPESLGGRGCYHRQQSSKQTERSGAEKQVQDKSGDICSKIIGIWKWNDLSRTITRFYEGGKVFSKNILKSEGTWECVDPINRIFTSDTWGKKREIKMSEDTNQLEGINAFTGNKLIGIRISNNPQDEIEPVQTNTNQNIFGR